MLKFLQMKLCNVRMVKFLNRPTFKILNQKTVFRRKKNRFLTFHRKKNLFDLKIISIIFGHYNYLTMSIQLESNIF